MAKFIRSFRVILRFVIRVTISDNGLRFPSTSNWEQFLLWSVPPDRGAQPLDAGDEVGVHVDAGAGQVDAHQVRAPHALRPPHGAGDL